MMNVVSDTGALLDRQEEAILQEQFTALSVVEKQVADTRRTQEEPICLAGPGGDNGSLPTTAEEGD